MKKITFFAIAALLSVVAFAQKPFFVPVSQQALQDKVVSTGITKPERTTSTTGQARRVAPRRAQSDYVVITEQPAGELKTFTRSGSYLYAENQNLYIGNQSGEVSIVFGENNEIYIKDPLMNYAYGSWVSGTYDAEAGKVTIPVPQNLLYVENYDACIAMVPIIGYNATDFTAQDITYTVTQSDGNMVLTLDGFTDYNKTLGAGWTDDNTIQVYGIGKVQLTQVKTPQQNESGFSDVKKFVENKCLGKTVYLDIDDKQPKDKYDRTLAIVYTDSEDINKELIENNLAEISYFEPSEFKKGEL